MQIETLLGLIAVALFVIAAVAVMQFRNNERRYNQSLIVREDRRLRKLYAKEIALASRIRTALQSAIRNDNTLKVMGITVSILEPSNRSFHMRALHSRGVAIVRTLKDRFAICEARIDFTAEKPEDYLRAVTPNVNDLATVFSPQHLEPLIELLITRTREFIDQTGKPIIEP